MSVSLDLSTHQCKLMLKEISYSFSSDRTVEQAIKKVRQMAKLIPPIEYLH